VIAKDEEEGEALTEHPTPAALEAFLASRLSAQERSAVLAHLLRGCELCREVIAPLANVLFYPGRAEPAADPADPNLGWEYEFPVTRAVKHALRAARERSQERETAAGEIAALLQGSALPSGPPADLGGPGGPGCRRGFSWCEQFLAESRAQVHEDPQSAVLLATFAVTLAESKLEADRFPPGQVADLRARARAELGNARRVSDDLANAESEMTRALGHAEAGTGDPLVLARIMGLCASLYRDQRRFAEAGRLLDAVQAIYRDHGESHLAGRSLVSQGLLLGTANDPWGAIRRIEEGIALLDPRRDPALLFTAVHSLIWFLVEAGQLDAARRLIGTSGGLYTTLAGAVDRIKLRWMEGRIAAALGNLEGARTAFAEARQGFASHGKPGDVALVSLDLATVYLRQGRPAEVGRLAEEMLVTFRALGIRREAIAALLLLQEAVQTERATLSLCAEIATQLRRFDREGWREA
jgi:tetratricopeptide (TPR) repeat protein